jgi:hypothetical protein
MWSIRERGYDEHLRTFSNVGADATYTLVSDSSLQTIFVLDDTAVTTS